MNFFRSIISRCFEGKIKRIDASGRPGETVSNREYFQHFGFTSRPPERSEGIVLEIGNIQIQIASDNRDQRIPVGDGEAAIYVDNQAYIHIKSDHTIEIKANTIKVVGDLEVTGTVKTETDIVFPSTLVPGSFISGKAHIHPTSSPGAPTTAPSGPPVA